MTKCKGKLFTIFLLFILTVYASFKMLYSLSLLSGIETLIRMILSIIILLLGVGFIFTFLRYLSKKKKKYFKLVPITLIYSCFLLVSSKYIIRTYNLIDNITTNSTTYSTSLITLKSNKVNKLEELDNKMIGIISDNTSIDSYELPNEIIKNKQIKNEIKKYDSYQSLISALYKKEINYAFVSTSYVAKLKSIDSDKYETIDEDTKIIYTEEKKIKNEKDDKNIVKEPFSMLIMGVDSEEEDLAKSTFNGDALMLLTFNPKTLSTTILSIPRDSYVPIACFKNKEKNKITHAAMYGEECMIKTIEDFTNIKINYYVKINFKGVINIIDALGGVKVDVPYSFCEQDSNRKWGKHTIYVEKGLKTLNGEEALALSRNRKNNTSRCSSKWTQGYRSDFVRGENQQLVLRAIINKLKEVNDLNKINSILDKVSNSMQTNLSTKSILSLYNIGKDVLVKSSNSNMDDLIGFERLHLSGYDARIYDNRTGLNLYNYVLYNGSIEDVSNAMKINLGLKKPEMIKSFSFDIEEEYESTVIGKGDYSKQGSELPSFVGKSEKEATKLARDLNLNVKVKYISSNLEENGNVLYQSYSRGTNLINIDELVLTVVKNVD